MAKVDQDYDVIVIGGGINGLTAGCYLQKAGLKVLILERRDEVGTLFHSGVAASRGYGERSCERPVRRRGAGSP